MDNQIGGPDFVGHGELEPDSGALVNGDDEGFLRHGRDKAGHDG
jgi:hypothetical protein